MPFDHSCLEDFGAIAPRPRRGRLDAPDLCCYRRESDRFGVSMRAARIRTALLLVVVTSIAYGEPNDSRVPAEPGWPAFVQQFVDGFMEAHPMMGFAAGSQGVRGPLPGLEQGWSHGRSFAPQVGRHSGSRLRCREAHQGAALRMRAARLWSSTATCSGWSGRNGLSETLLFDFDWNLDFLSPDSGT